MSDFATRSAAGCLLGAFILCFVILLSTASEVRALDCVNCVAVAPGPFEDVNGDGCFSGGTDIALAPGALLGTYAAGSGNGLVVPPGAPVTGLAGTSFDWTADGICIADRVRTSNGAITLTSLSGQIDIAEDVIADGATNVLTLTCTAPCAVVSIGKKARLISDFDIVLDGTPVMGARTRMDADGTITVGDPGVTSAAVFDIRSRVKTDGDIVIDHGGPITFGEKARVDSRSGSVTVTTPASESIDFGDKARTDAEIDIDVATGTLTTGIGPKFKTRGNVAIGGDTGVTFGFKTRVDSLDGGIDMTSGSGSIVLGERSKTKCDLDINVSAGGSVTTLVRARVYSKLGAVTVQSTSGGIALGENSRVDAETDMTVEVTSTGSITSGPSVRLFADDTLTVSAPMDVTFDTATLRGTDVAVSATDTMTLTNSSVLGVGTSTGTFAGTTCVFTGSALSVVTVDDSACTVVVP